MTLNETEETALESFVHTPIEANAAFVELANTIHNTTGISTGSPILDQFIFPTRPTWVRTWKARPGEGKTTMLTILAATEARRLLKEKIKNRYVAYISYETAVDTQEIHFQERSYDKEKFWRGEVPMDAVIRGGVRRSDLPIYIFGESMMKSGIGSPPMTINMVVAGIYGLYKTQGILPSLLILDYAQEIQVERHHQKRTQDIIEAIGDVIRMGTLVKCPIELGSQAKQTSVDKNPPIPALEDSEYSYYISQKSAIDVGMWRCWVTHKDNPAAQQNGIKVTGWEGTFPLSPNLTVFRANKNRYGMLKMAVPALVDVEKLRIQDIESVSRQLWSGTSTQDTMPEPKPKRLMGISNE